MISYFSTCVRQEAMYIVPRSWLKLFLYFAFALAGMSVLWLFIQDPESRSDISDMSRLGMRYVAGNRILNNTKDDLDQHTVTQAISAEDNPANKFGNKWIKLDSIGDRNIIEIENQNGRNDKSQTPWKIFTNSINQDTTKRFSLEKKRNPSPNTSGVHPKKTSVAHFQPATRNVYSSKSPKQSSLYFGSHRAKEYGERGCPDNPWRRGLSELVHAWTNISTQHNIEYVLACGSLLGAMRDSDVIPYDSDVDILIDINYYPILKRLAVERRYIASSDARIHLVLQPEFTLNIPVETRKRYDCQGKVLYFF